MPDDQKSSPEKEHPYGLDTSVPEPTQLRNREDFKQLWKFLHSSPSFRRVFYGTTGAFMLAAAGTAYVCVNGPDQTHNPILNGTADKLYPELKR